MTDIVGRLHMYIALRPSVMVFLLTTVQMHIVHQIEWTSLGLDVGFATPHTQSLALLTVLSLKMSLSTKG